MPNPVTGLTHAAAALRYYERRQETAANNLANVSTDGFRGERAFGQLMNDGVVAARTATDARAGTLRPTGNPLDLALAGDGYFVVQTAAGERLTRAGSFRLDADRRLVDAEGNAVLGEAGPITLPGGGGKGDAPAGDVSVGADGAVRVGQQAAGRLRLEAVAPGAQMAHDGGARFVPDATRRPLGDAERRVRQGALEESNVSPVGALVDMIAVQRAYAGVQKAVSVMDEVRGTAASQLGRPV